MASRTRLDHLLLASSLVATLTLTAPSFAQQSPGIPAGGVLRVCADPDSLPASNSRGEGYENKIAQALARDLGWKLEYTFFPQGMGFERNTLRNRDEVTHQYKCDLIMGVPSGYDRAATTHPYMHSTYALVFPESAQLGTLGAAEDLLKLPDEKLHALRIGLFARSPAADWVLRHGLIQRSVFYPLQSGDPSQSAEKVIGHNLSEHQIDAAILWGPIAGFLVGHHDGADAWREVPFDPDPGIKFDYEIAMGVRFGEQAWKDRLDAWIDGHHDEIGSILASYHVPLLALGEQTAHQ